MESKIPISFGKTLEPLLHGIKSVTRRQWSDRHAEHFIKCYEKGLRVPAFDKDRRYGGKQVGWLELTHKPYKSPNLRDIDVPECVAEGFPYKSPQEFIEEFFGGNINTPVWVVRFNFIPLNAETEETSMETKINEKLEWLESQLEKLSKVSPKTVATKKKVESESQSLKERIERLRKFSQFSAGERVSKGEQLGKIIQLSFSPGGMPEVWVKWDDSKPLSPESPELLSPVAIVPDVVEEELSHDEQRQLVILERKIERALQAFYEAGKALKEIRDRRLYRSTHKTFEDYCLDRFSFTRRRPYQLIDAAEVIDNLLDGTHDDNGNGLCTSGSQMLPSAERQVRPLTPLEPNQQREAWQQAVSQSGGKVPSGKVVKSIVDQIRERRPVPNPWKVGDVVSIIPKDNPDLKGKAGCWAIITEVNTFSCMVYLYDGEHQAKIENLKELPYSPEQKQQLRELGDRLSDIYSPEMEEIAKSILLTLGKINRPVLTELEEKLLRVLEGKEFDDYSLDELLELQGKIAELINDRQLKER